jgi:topoisomerase IV subunit B
MKEVLSEALYTEDSIKSLDWREHIRLRPGMYIGKLGDGTSFEDGIYILVKEVIDNSIDEHTMGYGTHIEVLVENGQVKVRDYGRGVPFGKLVDCVSKINTGGKYDSSVFQKSVGLNGVGTKAVNALSSSFKITSYREHQQKTASFQKGILLEEKGPLPAARQPNGTEVVFHPDLEIFKHYHYINEYLLTLIRNYTYLNSKLKIVFNGDTFQAANGLLDLLLAKTEPEQLRYPIVHLKGDDIEVALTHGSQYGEELYSFVNGQNTIHGGTHLAAFREAVARVVKEFYKKDFESTDIRSSIIGAVSIRIQEPVFESQTKTKLGSVYTQPEGGTTLKNWLYEFLKKHLDDHLHKNPAVAEGLLKRILQSERERKEIAGIRKLANERSKKANLHNKKLRDCRLHLNEGKDERRFESTLFITEGDSASGSITKSRMVDTQAVFSLRGKPLNCFGLTKKIVYENEEFNLLQHALNIEDSLEDLRYNKVVLATDADVDGMHIRLLMLTFFLQFFPDLVKNNHVYIMETPLFRVRNKKQTIYCYSEREKQAAVSKLGANPEITRFKGLGEISPDEFGAFIGPDIRLEPVLLSKETQLSKLLSYYMGKNTPERQTFIVDNLRIELDEVKVAPLAIALQVEE